MNLEKRALFYIRIGEYLHYYKHLPTDAGQWKEFDTKEFNEYLNFLGYHNDFKTSESHKELDISREVYFNFITKHQKLDNLKWTNYAHEGRKKVLNRIDSKNKAILENLLLLEDDLDKASSLWWSKLDIFSRSKEALKLTEIGRMGEDWTVDYEINRLESNAQIDKFFLESTSEGYDILSWIDKNLVKRLLIEVKTSQKSIDMATAYISKKEWEVAKEYSDYDGMHLFYFWLCDPKRLAKINYKDIEPHASLDRGEGKTIKFSVPFKIFEDKFRIIS